MDKRIRMIEESGGKGERRGGSGSCESIKKMWKRKRKESKDGLKKEKREAFRRSKKTIRLPKKIGEGEKKEKIRKRKRGRG